MFTTSPCLLGRSPSSARCRNPRTPAAKAGPTGAWRKTCVASCGWPTREISTTPSCARACRTGLPRTSRSFPIFRTWPHSPCPSRVRGGISTTKAADNSAAPSRRSATPRPRSRSCPALTTTPGAPSRRCNRSASRSPPRSRPRAPLTKPSRASTDPLISPAFSLLEPLWPCHRLNSRTSSAVSGRVRSPCSNPPWA